MMPCKSDLQHNCRAGLIEAKGENGLNLSNVRDFARVIENNRAAFGITMAQR
jgi:hypothetical protein